MSWRDVRASIVSIEGDGAETHGKVLEKPRDR